MTRTRVKKAFNTPSLTKQSFKDETNVNNIMAKYLQTGLLDHVNNHQGNYDNFVSAPDYHTAMNRITAADQAFESMPSDLRARFQNSAPAFLEFVQNPENRDQMIDMGLLPKIPKEPVTDPAAGDPAPANPAPSEPTPA